MKVVSATLVILLLTNTDNIREYNNQPARIRTVAARRLVYSMRLGIVDRDLKAEREKSERERQSDECESKREKECAESVLRILGQRHQSSRQTDKTHK